MCVTTFAALLGVGIGCAVAPRADLLAPADPQIETIWQPPPPPLRGVKRFQPEEARSDWGAAPVRAPAEGGDGPRRDMKGGPGMKGMSMPGMDMGGRK